MIRRIIFIYLLLMKCLFKILLFSYWLILLFSGHHLMAQEEIRRLCSHGHDAHQMSSKTSSSRTLEEGSIFKEVTKAAGFKYSDVSFGHAWSDINLDGYPDLFTTGHGKAQLYTNLKDGTFDVYDLQLFRKNDTIDGEVIPVSYYDMHGATFTDINHDGYPDLYIQLGGDMGRSSGKENLLFLNDKGTLIYENKAREYGVQDSLGRGRSSLFFDFNNDGYVDFMNSNLLRGDQLFNSSLYTYQPGTETFTRDQNIGLLSYSLRGAFLIQPMQGTSKNLLTITDAEDNVEIYDYSKIPFSNKVLKKHYGIRDVAIADFNGDGVQDFFSVSNRYGSEVVQVDDTTIIFNLRAETNKLGYNDENKISFKTEGKITIDSKIYPYKGGVAQYWRIGRSNYNPSTNIFTLDPNDTKNHNFANLCLLCLGANIGLNTQENKWEIYNTDPIDNLHTVATITSTQPITDIKTYNFQNSDLLSFDKIFIAQKSGGYLESRDFLLNDENLSTGVSVVAADFDNDMDMDILISCQGGPRNYPNRYYENDGTGKFKKIDGFGAESAEGGRSGSISTVDFNNDGFLDVFIENGEGNVGEGSTALMYNDGPYRLYQNKGNSNHWVKFNINDNESSGNTLAIGTTVYCFTNGIKQVRLKGNESHVFAQNDPVVHFGLGQYAKIDSVQIVWPDGYLQTLYGLDANTTYDIPNRSIEIGYGRPINECSLKIYPNPTNQFIQLESNFTGYPIDEIIIYDYLGNVVKSMQVKEFFLSDSIYIDDLSNGTYILQIIYSDGKICFDRFQIMR